MESTSRSWVHAEDYKTAAKFLNSSELLKIKIWQILSKHVSAFCPNIKLTSQLLSACITTKSRFSHPSEFLLGLP